MDWFNSATDYFEWMFHRLVDGTGQVFAGIAALVLPRRLMDSLRKRSAKRASDAVVKESRVGKTVENLEDRFHVAARNIGSVLSDIYKLFVPTKLIESTEKVVSSKSADVYWDFRRWLKKIGERFAPKWLTTRVGKLYDAIASIFEFVRAWGFSRDYKTLAWSLPAILLALPLAASFVGNIIYSNSDRVNHYNSLMAQAIEERDTGLEELCESKLNQLGAPSARAAYVSAMALLEEEKWDEAVAKMQSIASLKEAGYPPAHLWLASQIAQGKMTPVDPWRDFEQHAKHAFSESEFGRFREVHDTARRFLVEADLHYGRVDQAVKEMEGLIRTFPSLHGPLMEHYLREGNSSLAIKHARAARNHYRKAIAESGDAPPPMPQDFSRWIMACRLTGGSTELADILQRSRDTFPDDQQLDRTMVAQLMGRVADISFSDSNAAKLFRKAQELQPNHPTLILKLANSVLEQHPSAEIILDELERTGHLPAEVPLRLGDFFASRNDREKAVENYRRSCRVLPEQSTAWNNLAHVLSHMEPIDLESALTAVNKALDFKDDPRCLETRGQIFFKMERWEEAIADLEKSLNGTLPNAGPTHRSLSKAYLAIGDAELAAAHSNQASP